MYVFFVLSLSLYVIVMRGGAPRGGVMRAGVLSVSLLLCAPAPVQAKKAAVGATLGDAELLVDGMLGYEQRGDKQAAVLHVSRVWLGDAKLSGATLELEMSGCSVDSSERMLTLALIRRRAKMVCVHVAVADPAPYWGLWNSFASLKIADSGRGEGPLGAEIVRRREQSALLEAALLAELSQLSAAPECQRPARWSLSLLVSGDGRVEVNPYMTEGESSLPTIKRTPELERWRRCIVELNARRALTTRFEGGAVAALGVSSEPDAYWFIEECSDVCRYDVSIAHLSHDSFAGGQAFHLYSKARARGRARSKKLVKKVYVDESGDMAVRPEPPEPQEPLIPRQIQAHKLGYVSFGGLCTFEGIEAIREQVASDDDALLLAACAARWSLRDEALAALARMERRAASLGIELYGGSGYVYAELTRLLKALALWRGGTLEELLTQWHELNGGGSGRIGLLHALSEHAYDDDLGHSPWALQARAMLLNELHPQRRVEAIALLRLAVAQVGAPDERRRYLNALKAMERLATPQELEQATQRVQPWLASRLEDERIIRAKGKRKRVLTEREERGQEQAQATIQQAQVRAASGVFAARVAGLKAVDTQPAPADPQRGLRGALIVAIAIASLIVAALLIRRAIR